MAYSSSQTMGRVASLPLAGEACTRRSFEATTPCGARSRRGSVDLRAARGDHVLVTSVLSARTREGVHLEVGKCVDVNEQRRRLEHFWNTEDQSALEVGKVCFHSTRC